MMFEDIYRAQRQLMIRDQIERRGITSERLLEALRKVPRHLFIPGVQHIMAYADCALPIGFGQTISQPYIVAIMTDSLALTGDETVLEVGTGSGYQAAILSHLCRRVISLERIPELASQAASLLSNLHYDNIEIHHDDGSAGWPTGAPYQGILVTAAAPEVPQPLLEQLTNGGRLVIPVGPSSTQKLQLWRRVETTHDCQDLLPVSFVPLRGRLGWKEEEWRQAT